MGTWGPGNFDNDTAADHLSLVTSQLVDGIQEAMHDPAELEPDQFWGVAVPCNIELLVLIAKQGYVGCMIPDLQTVMNWRRHYMEVWERNIDQLQPRGDHKVRRREILQKTFDEFCDIARANEQ